MKQFYILPSGYLQIGDVFMLMSGFCYFMKEKIKIKKIDKSLYIFVIMASIINSMYYSYYKNITFILSSIYLSFSLIIVTIFRQLSFSDDFIELLMKTCFYAILTQTLVVLLGLGRWFGSIRYMGTFNDPNQFAYYIFSISLTNYACGILLNKNINIFLNIITFFLIFLSGSTGMASGYMMFLLFAYVKKLLMISKTKIICFLMLIFIICLVGGGGVVIHINQVNLNVNIVLFQRIYGKVDKMSNGIIYAFLKDRSLIRIFEKPIYLLFGAGEGGWFRFSTNHEMHSTMIALMFYYGVVPYMFFLKWLNLNLKNIKRELIAVYLPLILEAFTLINHRQPMFWFLIVIASIYSAKNKNTKIMNSTIER